MNATRGRGASDRVGRLILAVVTIVTVAAPLQTQPGPRRSLFTPDSVGIAGLYGRAVGEFADSVKHGGGPGFYLLWRPGGGVLGIRTDWTWIIYGSQTRSYSLLPGIDVDVRTDNSILSGMLGPQLTFGSRLLPLQAYVHGGLGFSVFDTSSHVSAI